LPLCRKAGLPLVYDVHHHRCLPDGATIEQTSTEARSTWNREPLFHISSPRDGWNGPKPQRHHDYIDPDDFPECWRGLDLTLEAMNRGDTRRGSVQIHRASTGRGFRLEASQFLPQPREQVFDFFSDAFQLQTLTPPWLHFSVLTPAPIRMATGALIDYRLRVHGIPMHWQSCIREWEPPLRFVDLQTRGPYRHWSHQHIFEAADCGTLCRDIVDYAVCGGSIIHALLVRRDLLSIFAFRQSKLRDLFPAGASAGLRPN
jgi:ligand-binding SRPBCC domain-containing protein